MLKSGTHADRRFKLFHELMPNKVKNILLVSSPYDAWVMEKDQGLSEAIVHEYRGLNLSHPPRLTWVGAIEEATEDLQSGRFDLLIVISEFVTSFSNDFAREVRKFAPNIPIVRLYHRSPERIVEQLEHVPTLPFERFLLWSGNTKLFLASIKSIEDELNVTQDTQLAGIRVIIFVEDSAKYLSSLLPVLYRELVKQTQRVIEKGLNEEHRMLAMRARPKILIASTFEDAMALFDTFESNVLGVISDVRFSCKGKIDGTAGIRLLKIIREKKFDIPLLLTSSESINSRKAASIPSSFVDKNSPTLHEEVQKFFVQKLGFGEFSFRATDGHEISRANDLRELGNGLLLLSDDLFIKHWRCNDFSRWLFTRGETFLAKEIRDVKAEDFDNDLTRMRQYLHQKIHKRRMQRQKGVIVDFDSDAYDVDTEFLKIGDGSLGGKARGLAFFATWIDQKSLLREEFEHVDIVIPRTLVLTTECFEEFILDNKLEPSLKKDLTDEEIAACFQEGIFSEGVREKLRVFLLKNGEPLAIRSSSLLEDSKYRAYAGLYSTYMVANDQENLESRLNQLSSAIKMVYASTYFQQPRSFSIRVGNRIEEEKMAVIIQPVVGSRHQNHFYPAISGVVQSHNYYPLGNLNPEDGLATIALGLGKAVMEGGKTLRFCPLYPHILPQRSSVDDSLDNAQREFYALKINNKNIAITRDESAGLALRTVIDAREEFPVQLLSSFYDPREHTIRDSGNRNGIPTLTFAQILKYNHIPLAKILTTLLSEGQQAMRCPVEIEFSVDLAEDSSQKAKLAILQIRPMGAREEMRNVTVDDSDRENGFCLSHNALGNTVNTELSDIVYVKPDTFNPAETVNIAAQIRSINANMSEKGRKYILIGPGRWGSADHWLGIPVTWHDISAVGAIVETTHPLVHAEPSQGSHFFHNITSLGIPYLNVGGHKSDQFDWEWLTDQLVVSDTTHVIHATSVKTITMKIDGRNSIGVLSK